MVYLKSFAGQTWLLPPSIESLIPQDHVCYLVESLVGSMDFSGFDEKYSGAGHPAYHPSIILKILVMGVLDKVRSSRKLARNARENVVYMYLSEKLAPDFRTISDFRKNNPSVVKEAFKHTVSIAKQEGVLDLSHLATDGSKIKANASSKRALTKEELEFLLKFVDGELEEWAKQDEIEDEQFGELRGSDQLPKNSKKKIEKTVKYYIKNLKEKGNTFKTEIGNKLERAKKEVQENDLNTVSLTDPESRFMKNKKKRIELSYNPQITTDKNGFIVANDVCQERNDKNQVKPQVNQTKENLGELPENVPWSFDNGYYSNKNLEFLKNNKIDAHVGVQKISKNPYTVDKFQYNPEKDEYTCPEGKKAIFQRETLDKTENEKFRVYKAQGCKECSKQKLCTKNKTKTRYLRVLSNQILRKEMFEKMRSEKGKQTYKLRKETAEPAFGDIKQNKGLTEFLSRSLKTVKTEFNLTCTASNIKKMWIQNKQHIQTPTNTLKNLTNLPNPPKLFNKTPTYFQTIPATLTV